MRASRPRRLIAIALGASLSWAIACGGENQGAQPASRPVPSQPAPSAPTPSAPAVAEPETPADPAALADRGRSIYMSNCIACHNPDPSQEGALGPPVTGASLELIEARVVDGTYPDGYTPKRNTKVMIPMPHLKAELPAVAAYLNP